VNTDYSVLLWFKTYADISDLTWVIIYYKLLWNEFRKYYL